MFVLASMAASNISAPVKIRNMSQVGALIEGATLPPTGEHVRLRRGELSASGRIVWRQDGKAGLQFDQDVAVVEWLPTGSGGQQWVDRTFHELKSAPCEDAERPASSGQALPTGHLELLEVAEALDALADCLAEDPAVVAAHGSKLQVLDMASQLLRRFAT